MQGYILLNEWALERYYGAGPNNIQRVIDHELPELNTLDVRQRLFLVSLHDGSPRPLTEKILARPRAVTLSVREGHVRFTTADAAVEAGPDELITCDPGVAHSVEAVTDAICLLHLTGAS